MDVRVLGSFQARINGRDVTPSAAKPRAVLALLALHEDQVVPVAVLTEELWGATPPRSASTTLQTYVMQLRRSIAQALRPDAGYTSKDVLRTEYSGYALNRHGGRLDSADYTRCLNYANLAMQHNDLKAACGRFAECLRLWRGPALVDVKLGSRLSVEATRLEESRLSALERRIECDLALGMHHMVLSELTALTSQQSMHEGLHRQLMIALYRSGRRSHALNVFLRLRTVLNTELGVEPSAQLQRLQRAILDADPDLERVETNHYPQASPLLRAG
ncbi:AfsR/SARP family transcriptional regulator [Dactylosporangium sp. NPDC051485]|uniref:AfsR/SARP family transcriptional regulator n=1 Tax=Dactylosporangium sp. NPDC051485 TaxID=3154846 RepID=UPI00341F914C